MSALRGDLVILIERGGIVMLPLLALSVISITLIVERIWFWSSIHRPKHLRRLDQLGVAMRRGNRRQVAKLLIHDRSPYGQVARRLLEHGASEAVAVDAVQVQRPKFDRFMVSLSTIITAAPLLGILGTVLGIIQSFNLLGEQETLTDPSVVSAGIAEALLTTAMGLVIALFTLFPYMIFRAQVERAIGRVESVIAAAQEGFRRATTEAPVAEEPAAPHGAAASRPVAASHRSASGGSG